MRICGFGAVLLAFVAASSSMAQAPSTSSIHGVVFDSLHGTPLSGAFVTIASVRRSTTSDVRGRFQFDSLGPGTYTFAIQHDVLDSIGIGSIETRATLGANSDDLKIAVPSFASLWRRWCAGVAPKDTGLVHGIVRDGAGHPLPAATIEVSWTDYSSNGKSLERRGKFGRVVADSNGSYSICGVPVNTAFLVRAVYDSATSGALDLVLGDPPIVRRDFRVALPSEGVGTIVGVVTRGGQPFAGARVAVGDQTEQRTDRDGKFAFHKIPAGTRQVEIFAVGMTPGVIAVDVSANDTALVTFDLQKVVALPGVKVEEATVRKRIFADIDERRRNGIGHFRDSTELKKAPSFQAMFGGMTGVRERGDGRIVLANGNGTCEPMFLVDGFRADRQDAEELRPDVLVALEVYPRPADVPSTLGAKLQRRPTCGVIAFWTRRLVP